MNRMIQLCSRESCTACFACENICPNGSVVLKKSSYGLLLPSINTETCLQCGACMKVCPVLHNVELYKPESVYAAYAVNNDIRSKSASGGIATVLAKHIIENNGVVYGSVVGDELKVEHTRVDSINDIQKIQGSKYVHSHINLQYRNVKKDVLDEKTVLFIGTPCEVAGLRSYLGNKTYDNLICVDLICHGVPAHETLSEAMKLECNKSDFKGFNISFRDADGFEIKIRNAEGQVTDRRNLKNSLYYNGFMEGYIYRSNCYDCRYAQSNRCGDITLGDFWGLGDTVSIDDDKEQGINVVLINTEVGNKAFEMIKPHLQYWERSLDEAVAGNGQLRHPVKRSESQQRFEKFIPLFGTAEALKKCNPKKTAVLKIRSIINKSPIAGIISKLPILGDKI